jgi:LmbE family N-acetylglucosaminyl deacetylase
VSNVLVVSSHLDDAVFSCWSVISDPALQVSVVTVFTSALPGEPSRWDALLDPTVDPMDRAAERRAEDSAALAKAGRTPIHLPFHDCGYGPTELLAVVDKLRPHIEAADVVYAPLAIWHDEHVLVRQAVRKLQLRSCFYVDYPYALVRPIRPQQQPPGLLDAYDLQKVPLAAAKVEQKLAACREYRGELDRLRTLEYGDFVTAEKLGRETFYVPQPLD